MNTISNASVILFCSIIKNTELLKKDLTNRLDIEWVAEKVYPVINPRRSGFSITLPNMAHIGVLRSIADRLFDYFNNKPNTLNTQANFDAFHDDLCNDFLSKMNGWRTSAPMTYGMAQKYINMFFKYLACFGNYSKFADLFSYCHIPIDRRILGAFEALRVPNVKREQYKNKSWSNLNSTEYLSLLKDYRSVLSPRMVNYPLLAFDFDFWVRSVTLPRAVLSGFSKAGNPTSPIGSFFR